MMTLYTDISNLLSLLHSNEEMKDESTRMLNKQFDVYFNFPKEEIKNHQSILAWMQLFVQGRPATVSHRFDAFFPDRPLKSNSTNNFSSSQLMSVYLLEDENIDKLKGAGSVIVGEKSQEIQVLKSFFLGQNDYSFDRELRIGEEGFQQWEDLEQFSTPLTDILIIDPYILKNTEVESTTIDHNLIKLLEVLCCKSRSKVNIVILVNPSNLSYNVDQVKDKIKTSLNAILGKKPNVTFVLSHKEHDRTVITNYLRITGNTFNYWNERKQKINKGKEITIKSLAKKEIYDNALKAYEDVQKIIDESPEIAGDKISNFLQFK